MLRYLKSVAGSAAIVGALAGCQHLPGKGLSRYVVRGSSARAPTNSQLASKYGCPAGSAERNWLSAKLAVAKPGTPMCRVIGRYGEPVSVSTSASTDMQLVSMIHRQPNGRYYNATFVYYADTRVNRRIGRPVGTWLVERVTVTR